MMRVIVITILLLPHCIALAMPTDDSWNEKIDKRLYFSEKNDVFINFYSRPSNEDIERISTYCERVIDAKIINTIIAYGFEMKYAKIIASFPNVKNIEIQEKVYPLLDVSCPAVLVRDSTVYDYSVWKSLGITGRNVTIAIIDTGVDNRIHQSLDDMDDMASTNDPKFVAGYDCSGAVWHEGDPDDNDGHGTHVAGIALGTGGHGHKYEGIAPGARLVDIKVMNAWGSAPAGKVIEGIRWAVENKEKYGIKVLSISLGTRTTSNGGDAVSQSVNAAVMSGLVVVVACGNDGPNNNGLPSPAAADKCIAVASIDDKNTIDRKDDRIASYSSRGPRQSDGDENRMDELKPDISAPGTDIISAMFNTNSGYISLSGTSMAAPHISGIVALMLDANPSLSPDDIKKILKDTAEARGTPYDKTLSEKYNIAYGWGIADGYGSVKRALDMKSGKIICEDEIYSGDVISISSTINFTRTPYTTTKDNVIINLSIPSDFGKPYEIKIDGGEVEHSSGFSNPELRGNKWNITAWINYTGVPNKHTNLTVNLTIQTFAPSVKNTKKYAINSTYSFNGMECQQLDKEITLIPMGDKPDITIYSSEIDFSDDAPNDGDIIKIKALIHNNGRKGTYSEVYFYDGPPSNISFIGEDNVSLPPNGKEYAEVDWKCTAGHHKIYVVADPNDIIDEENEKNNVAFRTIDVRGENSPPTAVLRISQNVIYEGDVAIFNASESKDIDGYVVLYKFKFGDGSETDWITDSMVEHVYEGAGKYTVSLQVRDNGDAVSDEVLSEINVLKKIPKSVEFYFDSNHKLSIRAKASYEKLMCPNGFTPIIPGSPVGTVEWKTIGSWHFEIWNDTEISDRAYFTLTFYNNGSDDVLDADFEIQAYVNDEIIGKCVVNDTEIKSYKWTMVHGEMNLKKQINKGDVVKVKLICRLQSDNVEFVFGSNTLSTITINFSSNLNVPPFAYAPGKIDGYAGKKIYFYGEGWDYDGKIIEYSWDYDGDGVFDYSGDSPSTWHIYSREGNYTAVLRVKDDHGDIGIDETVVIVKKKNLPPEIIEFYPEHFVETTEGEEVTFKVIAHDMEGDKLNYIWLMDDEDIGCRDSECKIVFNDSGEYVVIVTIDDSFNTVSHSWKVHVSERNHPPIVVYRSPENDFIKIDEGDAVVFSVRCKDEDGDLLRYEWNISGIYFKGQNRYVFSTDYESAGFYIISISISDDVHSITISWNVKVRDVNRLPNAKIISPFDGALYSSDYEIEFRAKAWDDDEDTLTYQWSSDIDGFIGAEKNISKILSPGEHEITLMVSDGKDSVYKHIRITVIETGKMEDEKREKVPAFTISILVVAVIVIVIWHRRSFRYM